MYQCLVSFRSYSTGMTFRVSEIITESTYMQLSKEDKRYFRAYSPMETSDSYNSYTSGSSFDYNYSELQNKIDNFSSFDGFGGGSSGGGGSDGSYSDSSSDCGSCDCGGGE